MPKNQYNEYTTKMRDTHERTRKYKNAAYRHTRVVKPGIKYRFTLTDIYYILQRRHNAKIMRKRASILKLLNLKTNIPGGKGRPTCKADNFTAIYEPVV
jgi:hypothetical protein